MIICEKIKNNITVISIQGTINSNTVPDLKNFKSASAPESHIVINFSDVDFLDSSAIGAINGITREKREHGGDVTLACMNKKVRKVFDVTHVYRLFDIYDDVDAAIENAEKKQTRL